MLNSDGTQCDGNSGDGGRIELNSGQAYARMAISSSRSQ